MGALIFFIGFLFSVPIYVRAIVALRPLAVDAGGARFASPYQNWELRTVTGRIAGANIYTTTTTTTTYNPPSSTSSYGHYTHRTSTARHDTLLLVDGAGQQHSLTLTNFHLEVFNDQIVTVCWAVKGRKQAVAAVLNHSTRLQFTGRTDLDRILVQRRGLFTLWTIGSILLMVIGSIVFGFLLALLPVLFFAWANRRQRRRFASSGMTQLWASTSGAAAAL